MIIVAASVFGQDLPLRQRLEESLAAKNVEEVSAILHSCSAEEARDFEAIILARAREEILAGNLDYASALAETVLLFNLDNTTAQDIYTAVAEAGRQKAALEERRLREAETARRAEAEAQAAREEEERKRREAEAAEAARLEAERAARAAEEEERKRREAEAEFLAEVRNVGLENLSVFLDVAPAAFQFGSSGFADSYNDSETINSRYGFQVEMEILFTHPYVAASLYGSGMFFPVMISGADTANSVTARLSIRSPYLTGPLTIGAGYFYRKYMGAEDAAATSVLYTETGSPLLGIGLENLILFGAIECGFHADWHVISAISPLIDFAFGADLSLKYSFGDSPGRLGWYVKGAAFFDAYFAENAMEYALSATLAIGAAFNEKDKK